MRRFFSLLLLTSLLILPCGCGGEEKGTEESPDVSTPDALQMELPPPGQEGSPPSG